MNVEHNFLIWILELTKYQIGSQVVSSWVIIDFANETRVFRNLLIYKSIKKRSNKKISKRINKQFAYGFFFKKGNHIFLDKKAGSA